MIDSFADLFERGDLALSNGDNAAARGALESALPLARAPYERALVFNGLAIVNFRARNDDRALELLDRSISECLSDGEKEALTDPGMRRALSEAWHDKGRLLSALGRDEEAIAAFDESLRRFLEPATAAIPASDNERRWRRHVVVALLMKAYMLSSLERTAEALQCCEEVIRRFDAIDDDRIQISVARAMRQRARVHGDLGRLDKEMEGFDTLIARFGASRNTDIAEIVLDTLEEKTKTYKEQDDHETVIEICDQIIDRYSNETDWKIADAVARAMVRRAVAFGKQGRLAKELDGYDEVARRYGDSTVELLRIHAAKALMFKAVTLNDADQGSAEIECYDEVLRRYGDDADEKVREVAADALIHKGLSLGAIAEDAAQDTGERETGAEIACYDEVVARYCNDEFAGLRRAVAEAQLHKGETLMEAGRTGEALACLDAVITSHAGSEDEDLAEIVSNARDLRAQI